MSTIGDIPFVLLNKPRRLFFSLPLAQITSPGTEVYRYFFPHTAIPEPGEAKSPGIAEVEREIAETKAALVQTTARVVLAVMTFERRKVLSMLSDSLKSFL